MRRVPLRGLLLGALAIFWFSQVAHAEPELSASEHYDHGLALVNSGDLAGAALEFETAYGISPNDVVLYNLGQAYLQLGNPAAALKAFEGYLHGTADVKPDRRREVMSLIAVCKRRVGRLSLSVEPPGSEIAVDGQSLGRAPLAEPISLSAGRHGLAIEGSGLRPFIAPLDIEPEKETVLVVRLDPAAEARVAPSLGRLALGCDVPAVQVVIDGDPAPSSVAGFLLVGVGKHRVQWLRDGYDPSETEVEVSLEQTAHGECDLRPRADLSPRDSGILSFSIDAPGAEVRIDGRAGPATVRLPRGPHRVLIRRSEYRDWTQTVNAEAAFPRTVRVQLHPNAERAAAFERARSRKSWAYVVGGAGLALLATGTALYVQNGERYGRWQDERDALSIAFVNDDRATLSQRSAALQNEAVSIQRRDDLALGVGMLGVGALGYAIASWLTADP